MRISDWSSDVCSSDLEEADRIVQSLTSRQPNNNLVVLMDAITQFMSGNYRKAKLAADRVLAVSTNQPQALLVAGYSAYHLGEYEQARSRLLPYLDRKSTRLNSSH